MKKEVTLVRRMNEDTTMVPVRTTNDPDRQTGSQISGMYAPSICFPR